MVKSGGFVEFGGTAKFGGTQTTSMKVEDIEALVFYSDELGKERFSVVCKSGNHYPINAADWVELEPYWRELREGNVRMYS